MEPVIVSIVFFLTVMVIWGGIIATRHRERMVIIEKGLNPEEMKSLYGPIRLFWLNPLSSLKWGLLLIMVGAALVLGMWLQHTYYVDDGVIPGLMAVFGGAGLVIFYFIARKRKTEI